MITIGLVAWDAYAVFSFLTTGILTAGTAITIVITSLKIKEVIINMIKKL